MASVTALGMIETIGLVSAIEAADAGLKAAQVRLLEQESARFARRVGIVNVGIDDIGYLLASQDSIRTSLYWRLIRALGDIDAL